MKLEVLKNKYHNNVVEDAGAYMSQKAKNFARHIKAYLTGVAYENDMELVQFNVGHYYISGFFKKRNKYVYFSREIERYNKPINLENKYDILIRTAESDKDYRGGFNYYTGIATIGRDSLRLLNF